MRALLAGTILLAACASNQPGMGGDGSGPGSGTEGQDPADIEKDYDDVAASFASMVRGPEVAAMADAVVLAFGGSLDGFTISTTPAGDTDAVGTRGGVTYHYTYHCNDDLDDVLPACGPTVNHEHIVVALEGGGITHTSDWTVRNIEEQKPRVDRSAHVTYSTTATDGAKLALTIDGMWDRVRFDPQPTMPHAGSIDTIQITAHRERASASKADRDFELSAQMTFSTAGQATIVLDGTHTYAVDMASGNVTRM